MNFRRATAADIPALMALEREATTAAHWRQADYDRVFDPISPPRLCLVMEDEAGIQGFLVARNAGLEWELENIIVAASARRRGIGKRLLAELTVRATARGAQTVFLEVRESNLAARRLYENANFLESGRRKQYYREPAEDAISYVLLLVSVPR